MPATEDGDAGSVARLFAAVWPPVEVVDALAALPRPEERGLRWTAPAQWHVTVAFLGGVLASAVDALGSALVDAVNGSVGPVELHLGPATCRLGRSVLCVPVAGLDELASSTRAALAAVLPGAVPDTSPFRGHLTLARARSRHVVPASLVGVPVVARWTVDAVCLVRSELAPAGARYTTVVRATVPS